MKVLTNDWMSLLKEEFQKPYYLKLQAFLEQEYASHTVYPDQQDIFNALRITSYASSKVVILGQDPYHGEGQAHGLSFSVKPGIKIPPSLKNIYKELQHDAGCSLPHHGYLISWAKQGVLLLNTVLTVREGQPNSHKGVGWENVTDEVIRKLNERTQPLVFICWGKHAQEKRGLITASHHLVIESPHPSPLSAARGFFGSKPFTRTNQFLVSKGMTPIDWQIPNIQEV